MTAMNKLFSRKVTIDIDYGEERKLFSFKDTRVKDDLGKVKSFNSVVDALNFMGRSGWKLVTTFLVTEGSNLVYHYILRREFDKSELVDEQAKYQAKHVFQFTSFHNTQSSQGEYACDGWH
jgi:hypothetical protein